MRLAVQARSIETGSFRSGAGAPLFGLSRISVHVHDNLVADLAAIVSRGQGQPRQLGDSRLLAHALAPASLHQAYKIVR